MQGIKETLKKYFWLPMLAVLGFIYFLITSRDKLKSEVAQIKAEKELGEVLVKKEEAKKDATKAVADWDAVRDKYTDPD